jgi:opacity protein-like surface antigen
MKVADATFTTHAETYSCQATQNWKIQWLNKLGMSFGDARGLGYLAGGVAVTDVSAKRRIVATRHYTPDNGDPESDVVRTSQHEASTRLIGIVLGAGVQFAVTDNLSLGVEYLHTQYAGADTPTRLLFTCTTTGGVGCQPNSNTGSNMSDQFRSDAIRFVMNYKLWE